MLNDVIEYPGRGDQTTSTLLIGGALNAFALLVFPLIALAGYYVQVLKGTIDGHEEPPAFGDLEAIAVDGLVASVVFLAFGLVPLVVSVVLGVVLGGAGSALTQATNEPGFAMLGALTSVLLPVLVGSVLWLAVSYVAIIPIANYAYRGSAGALADVGTVADVATDGAYLKAWVVGTVLLFAPPVLSFFIHSAIGFVLGLIPILGALVQLFIVTPVVWIVTSVAIFYAATGAYRAYGVGFAEAVGSDRPRSAAGTPDGAVAGGR